MVPWCGSVPNSHVPFEAQQIPTKRSLPNSVRRGCLSVPTHASGPSFTAIFHWGREPPQALPKAKRTATRSIDRASRSFLPTCALQNRNVQLGVSYRETNRACEEAPLREASTFNILSMDGGPGAAIQIRMLEQLEKMNPGFLARIDLLAGTSNGALLGLYLAANLSDDHAENLKVIARCSEFSRELIASFYASKTDIARFVLGKGPLLRTNAFRRCLDTAFTSTAGRPIRLGELRRKVLVMSFNADTWEPKIFNNFGVDPENDETLADVGHSSGAMPLVFPVRTSQTDHATYLDGGIVTNNPTMSAVTHALQYLSREVLPNQSSYRLREGLAHLRVLSLGAGHAREKFAPPGGLDLNWGWKEWLLLRPTYLPRILLDGSVRQVDQQCRALLDEQYLRFEAPPIPSDEVFRYALLNTKKALASVERGVTEQVQGKERMDATCGWIRDQWCA